MTRTTSQTQLQRRPQPSWMKVVLPLLYALPYLVLIGLLLSLVAGCTGKQPESRFELDLQSTVFGDIIIEQGGKNSTQLTINRAITAEPFPAAIELNLLDAPEWLKYSFVSNPVASDKDVLTLMAGPDAVPGIYRVQLHGTGVLGEHTVTDAFTFHIKVTANQASRKSANVLAESLSFFEHLFN